MRSITLLRRPRTASMVCLAVVAAVAAGTGLAAPSAGVAVARVAAPSHVAKNHCRRSAIDVPACGVLWGLFKPWVRVPGKSRWSAHYGTVEHQIGRRLDIVKDYVDWQPGDTFPSGGDKKLARGHRTLYFSWTATNFSSNAKISYSSIAAGEWDKSVIRPEARHLKRFHHKVFIDFNHEPDATAQGGRGSAAQYVAAYRHIHKVFARAHVKNVIWSWVTTGYLGNAATIRADYPGRRYVDWIGWDPYNLGSCAGWKWRTPYSLFHPFYRWVTRQRGMKHKPLLLAEYGSTFSGDVKGWYASVAGALRRLPRIKAVMQFSGPTASGCDVKLTDSAAALAGFAASARSHYVTGAAR